MKKVGKLIFLLLVTLSLTAFVACSDGDGGNSSSSEETLVTKYVSYMTANSEGYYRVAVYNCVETSENNFTVKSYEMHYFSSTTYSGNTGTQLIKIVKNKTVSPSESKNATQSKTATTTATNSEGTITFNIPEGIAIKKYLYK